MQNKLNPKIRFLLFIMLWELAIIAVTGVMWWSGGKKDLNNYSDTLFVISCCVLIAGTIIVITSTSKRHYYKYVKEKSRGVENHEEKYQKDVINRKRYTGYGGILSFAGLIGLIISGVILYI